MVGIYSDITTCFKHSFYAFVSVIDTVWWRGYSFMQKDQQCFSRYRFHLEWGRIGEGVTVWLMKCAILAA
jgi:hypothetical protein